MLFYDMTERARQEAEVHRLKEELEARVAERTHELMEKQEQLRTMAAELTLTEQRERRRLATDLHDYLAQLLVVGRMKLGQLRSLVDSKHPRKTPGDIDQVLEQSLTYTKSLVAELSPQVLYQFDFRRRSNSLATRCVCMDFWCRSTLTPIPFRYPKHSRSSYFNRSENCS